MSARKIGIILCAGWNIVAGAAGAFAGGVFTLLSIGFGGQFPDILIPFSLLLAGFLYAGAGACFAKPNQQWWSKGLSLQGLAILLGLLYVIVFLLLLRKDGGQLDPHDEEVLMFLYLPAGGLLLAMAEYAYLWAIRPQKSI